LNTSGYTQAASAFTKVNGTSTGQQWLSELPNGNYTAFVPNNAACAYLLLILCRDLRVVPSPKPVDERLE
jgi:hypothetical protein